VRIQKRKNECGGVILEDTQSTVNVKAAACKMSTEPLTLAKVLPDRVNDRSQWSGMRVGRRAPQAVWSAAPMTEKTPFCRNMRTGVTVVRDQRSLLQLLDLIF
jgi:hypothetical protein